MPISLQNALSEYFFNLALRTIRLTYDKPQNGAAVVFFTGSLLRRVLNADLYVSRATPVGSAVDMPMYAALPSVAINEGYCRARFCSCKRPLDNAGLCSCKPPGNARFSAIERTKNNLLELYEVSGKLAQVMGSTFHDAFVTFLDAKCQGQGTINQWALTFYNEFLERAQRPTVKALCGAGPRGDFLTSARKAETYFSMLHAASLQGQVPLGRSSSALPNLIELVKRNANVNQLSCTDSKKASAISKKATELAANMVECFQLLATEPGYEEALSMLSVQSSLAFQNERFLTRFMSCAEPAAAGFIREYRRRSTDPIICISIRGKDNAVLDPCENCRRWVLRGGELSGLGLYVDGMIVRRSLEEGPHVLVKNLEQLQSIRRAPSITDLRL